MNYDVTIIGAGASGLMCASVLKIKNQSLKVLVLEKNDKVGKKLSITGNGRCNLGNSNNDLTHYHSNDDIKRFKNTIEDNSYIDYLNKIGVLTTKEEDRIYPYSMQAISVCKSFERFLLDNNVQIKYEYEVKDIKKEDNKFIINDEVRSNYVVVATGGLTYPKTGSTGTGYEILKSFKHDITSLYPSLTYLKTNYKYIKELQGVRANGNCKLFIDGKLDKEEKGQIQFAKDALSGICIFNLSRMVKKYLADNKNVKVVLDLVPEKIDLKEYINGFPNYKVQNALSCIINNKLAFAISKQNKVLDKTIKELSSNKLDELINDIHNMTFEIIGVGDLDNAQVTNGGASLSEFDNNLNSSIESGLYAIGEVLDVDGDCGGYNLAWAFKSAILAADDITSKLV